MSLMNACILMLLLQPLFVYLALFKKSTGSGIKSVDNDDASYLFIAPGLSVFILNNFLKPCFSLQVYAYWAFFWPK